MRRMTLLVGVLGALVLFDAACTRGGDHAALPGKDREPVTVANSCVETYFPDTLVHRSFAFDGTVLAVEVRTDPHLPESEDEVPWVTFEVNRWFRGGSASEVGV